MNTLRNQLKQKYSQIPNELITDLTISSGALRVLLYLFTKPDNWNVYNSDICKQLNISEKTLTKYWKELLSSKWLRREKKQSEKGVFNGGYDYLIGSFTISEESSEQEESSEHNKNKLINKEEINNKEKINKKERKESSITTLKENKKNELISILKEKDLSKINKKSLYEWLEYKNFKYQKIGLQKVLNFLSKFDLFTQSEIVDNSIMNGYQGLFEPKQKQHYQKTAQEKTADAVKNFFQKERDQQQNKNIEDGEIYE